MPRLYNRYEFLDRRRLLRQQSSKAERILWERLRARRFLGLSASAIYDIALADPPEAISQIAEAESGGVNMA